jgi:hypothetical protein
MAKGGSRPSGGRPPGRRGRAGVGPGPGYRSGGTGKGSTHKSSSTARGPVAGLVFGIAFFAVLFVGTPITYIVYEYAKTR